jgi:hypothetical protein
MITSTFILFLTFILGISLGAYIYKKLTIRAINIETERISLIKKNQFLEVLLKIKNDNSTFKSRVNDTVYISTDLDGLGDIDVIYLMDKNDIAIFQGTRCLNTSDGVDSEIISDIILSIYKKFSKEINDIIEILGFKFYREEFERSFNIKTEDLENGNFLSPIIETNEIDKINQENRRRFDIDDILDKISKLGISSLTSEEKIFLDNYSNEKRN